ncbi:MAG: TSUP family transporter [Cyanobium sp.]
MPSFAALIGAAAAGMGAGLINAVAGGGSLLSFPLLTGLGLPALIANTTNSVALSPGYGGAAWAQRRDLAGQGGRLVLLLPVAALGGLLGGLLLLHSGERLFRSLVPWLILLGSLLLALQEPLRNRLQQRLGRLRPGGPSADGDGAPGGDRLPACGRRAGGWRRWGRWRGGGRGLAEALSLPPVLLASLYGGYFGAGQSVILLAVLGICLQDSLPRLNGLKQAIALAANLSAALLFVALGRVDWSLAAALGLGSLLGGALGGRLVGHLDPALLRGLVVTGGVIIALLFLLRG